MFLQVLVQVDGGGCDILPQLVQGGVLVGVGVEGARIHAGVQDAGAELGQVHLGDALAPLGEHAAAVFHRGGVVVGSGVQDIGALERVQTGLGQVVVGRAGADEGRIHLGEDVQGLHALVFAVDAGQHSIGREIADGGDGDAGSGEGAGESAAEVHRGEHVLAVGVQLTDGLAQPALGDYLGRLRGVPDVQGAEVGAVGLRITDALEHGNFALVVEVLHGIHCRMETNLVVDVEHIGGVNAHRLPIVFVKGVVVGNDGVEGIVGARHLEDHQHPVFLVGRHRVCLLLSNLFSVIGPGSPSLYAAGFSVPGGMRKIANPVSGSWL